MARGTTARLFVGAANQPVATAASRAHSQPTATAATVARAAASNALPPGESVPGVAGADGHADVPGRDESAEDLRGHSQHVPEDLGGSRE